MFRQVYLGLREAILSGTFRCGEKLPSTRDIAEQLGISRTVALLAYDQLLAEGFVTGRGVRDIRFPRRGCGPLSSIEEIGQAAPFPFWVDSRHGLVAGDVPTEAQAGTPL